jgi:hypothetical protein
MVCATMSLAAHAADITFATAPYGSGFTGPVTEAGFTYSKASGSLFVNTWGKPGADMELTTALRDRCVVGFTGPAGPTGGFRV